MKARILAFIPTRRGRARTVIALVVVGLVAAVGTALAVHDEAFELDGNIDDNAASLTMFDWNDDIVGVDSDGFATEQATLPSDFFGATAGPDFTTTINRQGVRVPETADTTTFTTNSKDILDINAQWKCVRANNVTDKGDLVNTYAVAYTSPSTGDLILYFGAEKNDASGTNNIGVWFLQDETVDCTGGQGGGGTAFTGSHQIGDILVVSQFSNGGSVATITAYVWDPTDPDAQNNLVNLGTSGRCDEIDSEGLDDRLCAITNSSGALNPPWLTWDKDANTLDSMDTQQFYEGAINVSAFGLDPCINTLLTNTRSSVETTATLYDYARQPFSVCNDKSGVKFHDKNADGDQDTGEPGLSGWTIDLYTDADNNDVVEAGQDPADSRVTGTDGSYSFGGLQPGNYIVCEVQQPNWFQSRPVATTTPPSGETLATCPGGANGYAFQMGFADQTGNDFGNYQKVTVSGMKFKDRDDDGVKDAGEPGLSGWDIHLFGTDGQGNAVHQVATTGTGGTYSFTGVTPGGYTVCEVLQANWVQSFPTSGADCSGHTHLGTITPGPLGYSVTAVSGDGTLGDRDFGNSPLSNITVTFNPLVAGQTHATNISCVSGTTNVGTDTDNSLTTSDVRVRQSPVVCTITYVDP